MIVALTASVAKNALDGVPATQGSIQANSACAMLVTILPGLEPRSLPCKGVCTPYLTKADYAIVLIVVFTFLIFQRGGTDHVHRMAALQAVGAVVWPNGYHFCQLDGCVATRSTIAVIGTTRRNGSAYRDYIHAHA